MEKIEKNNKNLEKSDGAIGNSSIDPQGNNKTQKQKERILGSHKNEYLKSLDMEIDLPDAY